MAVTSAAHSADASLQVDITPLMLASRAVAAAMVRSLESVDASVSVTQMRVLVLLWTGEPLNLSAVAEGLGVNASNASRTCDRLVSAGLVDRGELTADRRQRVLTLTRKGRTFVEQLMDRREQELAEIVAPHVRHRPRRADDGPDPVQRGRDRRPLPGRSPRHRPRPTAARVGHLRRCPRCRGR